MADAASIRSFADAGSVGRVFSNFRPDEWPDARVSDRLAVMAYLVGMDEAGYGPNLGPLVITATVWRIASDPLRTDLYRRLKRIVSAAPDAADPRVAIADSKLLYKPGAGLKLLERGVLPALAAAGQSSLTWSSLWNALEADAENHRTHEPWFDGYDRSLPVDIPRNELDSLHEKFRFELARRQVEMTMIRSTAILPASFNHACVRYGNKAEALSRLTLALLAKVLASVDEPAFVVCDKHGGRNCYQRLLQEQFPETLVEVRGESRSKSIYAWGPAERRIEVQFCMGGESFLPAALASMTCKYLRELSMQAFNQFWRRHVPELRPTAGYSVDAKRFKSDIAGVQSNLGIEDHILWRER